MLIMPPKIRNVAVTGASAGVGRATALRFAKEGAAIGLIARDEEALNDVKNEIKKIGSHAVVAAGDVSDPHVVFDAAKKIEKQLGPIDVWINDAMVTVFSPLSQMTAEEFRRVTEVTYLGFVYGTMAALHLMRKRDRGTIVQVGSALAYRGIPLQTAYCGAKYAIRGFTDSLRTELAHERSHIFITVVNLPAVNTPQFDWARIHMPFQPRPVPPVFQPEVAAGAIARAAREHRREYWLGLSTVEAILGNIFGPSFLDRYLANNAYNAQMTNRPVSRVRKDNLEGPVHALHRTRGSFSDEASNEAIDVPGPATRLAVVAAGAICISAIAIMSSKFLR
jgi:NAD(P)-dependent dehydrogenase (short-subunit alcohol dehydrogenase family)